MVRRPPAAPGAEWDAKEAPPTAVKKVRNAGRQFETSEVLPKRSARAAQMSQQTKESTRRRTNWERTAGGRERMRDVVDYATEQHNKMARERPELGLTPQKRLKLSPRQAYEHYGFGEHATGPTMHDVQIPGLEDPHALPRPKRWEEHSPEQQADIAKRVKAKSGATPESMERSFGSQLDQGYLRARHVGAKEPYAQTFYSHGEPAQQLRATSKRQDVPLGLVAAVNADTSPNMKFKYEYKSGEVRYPNAELAEHIIKHVKAGKDPDTYSKEGLTGHARSGYPDNIRKGAERARQVMKEGKSVGETFAGTGKASGFGPKTAAYHNAWLTGTPQFFVSDLHSGGGGMAPHLSSGKPLMLDEKGDVRIRKGGQQVRAKSQREEAIETTGFHAMADYAARQAMAKRGLSRVPQAQATQWGEETIRRHEQASDPRQKAQFPTQERSYPPVAHPVQFGHHQGRLF